MPFVGGEIEGQIVEVLLPKKKEEGEKDGLYLQTRPKDITITARTVYLQVGETNVVQSALVDLTMADDVCDQLTKVSEDDEVVVRVLRRYGASEELVLIEDERRLRQSINIRADFVRIIPPLGENPNLEDFIVDSKINARHALIGDKHKIIINPDCFLHMFDSTRPVLRALRLPPKPTAVFKDAENFPNVEKDHLLVLEICGNRCTTRALEQNFANCPSPARTKIRKDYHDVKVTVSEMSEKNERTEIRKGVLFKREPSFDRLRGVVGYWFRFLSAKNRYIVTFSLWKERGSNQTSELLDHIDIAIETSERKSPPRKNRCSPKQIPEEKLPPGCIHMNQASLPGQFHIAAETKEQKIPPRKKRKQRHLLVSEGKSLPGRIRNKQTSLPGEGHRSVTNNSREKSFAAEVSEFYEQSGHIMDILLPLRDDGEWNEFDRKAEELQERYATNINLRIVVVLEQGMAACYRNQLRTAEDFVKQAMAMFSQASSVLVSLLKGRASYYLAGIYRRDRMTLGRAQRCIDSANKHLKNTVFNLDRACLAYEEGSLLLEQAHVPCMTEQAKRCFDRCIEICWLGSKEDGNNLLLKIHDLALMKKAMLLLDCCTESGQEGRSVEEKTLREAKKCLNSLIINTAQEMLRIAQVQYHLVQTDKYFREQRLVDACAHAQIALDLSHRYSFDTTEAAEVRLAFVNKLCTSN